MNVVKLRAHHIQAGKEWREYSRQEIIKDLVVQEYVDNAEHPFVDIIFHFLGLWQDASQQFRLQVGDLDYICRSCPKLPKCNPLKHEEDFVSVRGDYVGRDSELVAMHKLDISREYSVAELLEML